MTLTVCERTASASWSERSASSRTWVDAPRRTMVHDSPDTQRQTDRQTDVAMVCVREGNLGSLDVPFSQPENWMTLSSPDTRERHMHSFAHSRRQTVRQAGLYGCSARCAMMSVCRGVHTHRSSFREWFCSGRVWSCRGCRTSTRCPNPTPAHRQRRDGRRERGRPMGSVRSFTHRSEPLHAVEVRMLDRHDA